jgi:hypothetical protein
VRGEEESLIIRITALINVLLIPALLILNTSIDAVNNTGSR